MIENPTRSPDRHEAAHSGSGEVDRRAALKLLATGAALALGGYARGVLVTSVEGRPIRIEGNPRHPASLGATDVFAEASVLSLYDPDRGKAVRKGTGIFAWEAFEAALL